MRKVRLFIPLGYRKNGDPIYRIAGGSEPAGVENTGGESQGSGENQNTGQQPATGGKPYDEYLNKVPETLRPTIEPVFQEWDANTTKKFQESAEKLSAYEPYQGIFDQYEPEAVQNAIELAERLSSQDSAEEVFQQLAQALGYEIDGQNVSAGGQGSDDDETSDLFSDPRFTQLQEGMGNLAGFLMEQQQQQQERELEQQVEKEWQQEVEKNKELLQGPDGKINSDAENMVMLIAANQTGGDIPKAFEVYANAVGKQAASRNIPGQTAPIVGGGAQNSMPSNVVDASKWDAKQRKETALAVLRANKQQT